MCDEALSTVDHASRGLITVPDAGDEPSVSHAGVVEVAAEVPGTDVADDSVDDAAQPVASSPPGHDASTESDMATPVTPYLASPVAHLSRRGGIHRCPANVELPLTRRG